jgi:hypothetical protein
MTTDERISQDLAVVGRTSRERPIALEVTLRSVGALPIHATNVSSQRSAPGQAPFPSPLAVLRVAHLYTLRVARITASFAAVACTFVLLVYVCFIHLLAWRGPDLVEEIGWMSKFWVAVEVLFVVAIVHELASRIAARRCERMLASADLETLRQHARGLRGLSTLAAIVGAMTFVLFFGMMQVSVGGNGLVDLFNSGPVSPSLQTTVGRWTIAMLMLAISGTLVASIMVARGNAKPAMWRTVLGCAVVSVTIILGLRFDVGPGSVYVPEGMPSMWLRGCLTATGTVGLFLLVSNLVLHIRVREDTALSDSSPS